MSLSATTHFREADLLAAWGVCHKSAATRTIKPCADYAVRHTETAVQRTFKRTDA